MKRARELLSQEVYVLKDKQSNVETKRTGGAVEPESLVDKNISVQRVERWEVKIGVLKDKRAMLNKKVGRHLSQCHCNVSYVCGSVSAEG